MHDVVNTHNVDLAEDGVYHLRAVIIILLQR